jgi:hypothetical protein
VPQPRTGVQAWPRTLVLPPCPPCPLSPLALPPLASPCRRGQLKALVDLHSETAGLGGTLSSDEINIIRGALDLTSKTALQAMTPISKVRGGAGWRGCRSGGVC